jgi:methyltransferase (TIGR00027 family)
MTDNGNKTKTKGGPSKMAEGIALQRFIESKLPEDEQLFHDPYAVHFLDPGLPGWIASHPAEAHALTEEWEKKMPGWRNAIRARIRYFDDTAKWEAGAGLEQLVIPGAGYDTRAYRMDGLRKLNMFEIDRAETIKFKTGIVAKLFGSLPEHVAYIPADLNAENLKEDLFRAGYSSQKKTLFLLEGLVMYMPRDAVCELLVFIRENSLPGSRVLFDCLPEFMVDGTIDREGSGFIRNYTHVIGEPFRFGLPEGTAGSFLAQQGFDDISVLTGEDFRRLYFTGQQENQTVSGLMSVVYGRVPDPKSRDGGAVP